MGSEIKILFYIIIFIGYLIYNLFLKDKTPKQTAAPVNNDDKLQEAEEILKEIRKTLSLEKTVKPEITPTVNDTVKQKPRKKAKPSPLLSRDYKSGNTRKPLEQIPVDVPHLDHTIAPIADDYSKQTEEASPVFNPHDMDMRKAVIFSEILKRPQY